MRQQCRIDHARRVGNHLGMRQVRHHSLLGTPQCARVDSLSPPYLVKSLAGAHLQPSMPTDNVCSEVKLIHRASECWEMLGERDKTSLGHLTDVQPVKGPSSECFSSVVPFTKQTRHGKTVLRLRLCEAGGLSVASF